jgi:hypothetical protein
MLLSEITKNPDNPRLIKDEKFARLKKSIKEFPQMMTLRPIVIDDLGVVLGGNMRLEALKALGYKEIPNDWLKRASELSEEEKKRFIISDNSNFGEWDFDLLANEWSDYPLAEWGVDIPEDWGPVEKVEEDEAAIAEMIDRAAELQVKWATESGQLWEIGRHRLLCGDCTNGADIERLLNGEKPDAVVTDPPYGVGVAYSDFEDSTENALELVNKFMPILLSLGCPIALTSGHRLMWDYPRPKWVMAWIHPAGMGNSAWGFTQFHPILVYGKDPYLAAGLGGRPDSIVMAVDREGEQIHPTSKPIKVWEWLVERLSPKAGQLIFEPFGGSGTTLVAAEDLNRKCYAVELSPSYVAVTLERLSALGLTPKLTN